MFRILLLFAVFALANSQNPPTLPRPKPQTCNVLALGGGGSGGAWEAGVISQIKCRLSLVTNRKRRI